MLRVPRSITFIVSCDTPPHTADPISSPLSASPLPLPPPATHRIPHRQSSVKVEKSNISRITAPAGCWGHIPSYILLCLFFTNLVPLIGCTVYSWVNFSLSYTDQKMSTHIICRHFRYMIPTGYVDICRNHKSDRSEEIAKGLCITTNLACHISLLLSGPTLYICTHN